MRKGQLMDSHVPIVGGKMRVFQSCSARIRLKMINDVRRMSRE